MVELRKRKGKKSSNKATKPPKKRPIDVQPTDELEENWKTTVRNHWAFPFLCISAAILLPYGFYLSYFSLLLQRPDLLSRASLGLWQFRPAVGYADTRQVLIVGPMSSGTTQTAYDLRTKLRLEIGHENSDTSSHFVRDGTISWFHITRFLNSHTNDEKIQSLHSVCANFTKNMGFHPNMYRSSKTCTSQDRQWSSCWKLECYQILHEEWGCAMGGEFATCKTRFAKVLHQTRHPLRTIESLVTKFCIGGTAGSVQPAFVKFASALFPRVDFDAMSCIEAAGYYVVEYHRAALAASELGVIDGRFQIESVSTCDIARMAGFGSYDAVYEPNQKVFQEACEGSDDHEAKKPIVSTAFSVSKGKLQLDWNDLLGGRHGSTKQTDDPTLRDAIQLLTRDLGYDD